MKKHEVICLVSMFPFCVCLKKFLKRSWNCLKTGVFCNLMLNSARNLSLLKSLQICIRKVSLRTFQKIVFFIMRWCTVSKILKIWGRQILLSYCRVSILFDILIASISWTVAQTPIDHIIFRKSIMRTFRYIYTNCFNRLRFLAENNTKLRKMNSFGQFKDLAREHRS